MAAPSLSQHNTHLPIADDASDYGSDIDDATALELLSQAESQPMKDVVLENIEESDVKDEPLYERIALRLQRLQASLETVQESSERLESLISERRMREASIEVEYDESNRIAFSPSNLAEQEPEQALPTEKDTRAPIERFRKPPKKPLSVTDLVSPAWCEQQYEYSLTKYGRVRATPAMKQGSSVHKELEEQVHVAVRMEVETKEDRFALRLWNVIEGLRTIRDTGMTRELEVFGVVEDEVIIGIIDQISTTCPDENMEAAIVEDMHRAKAGSRKGSKNNVEQLPTDQRTLTDFMTSSQNGSILERNPAFLGTLQQERPKTHYIKDIKTRQSRTLPAAGSPSRPTHMQLMLYHVLLSALASNTVPAQKIFQRYRLKPDMQFSDKLIAQIANVNISNWPAKDSSDPRADQDPLAELLEHSTLTSLWCLMVSEYALTFPMHLGQVPISPLLTAEFRTAAARVSVESEDGKSTTEAAGTIIGQRSFPFDASIIERYIKDEMAWWKGKRETKGVDIEEAFKCRICEFADGCTWRATKIEEGLQKARLRKEGRKKSEV